MSPRQEERGKLVPLVREIHWASRGTYGARRMAEELTSQGFSCDRYKARTLMKLAGVAARRKRKFKATTDSRHHLPVSPNLLDRQFEAVEPNRAWVSDITYIWTTEGWLYLTVILDLFSRLVVGWSMNNRINRSLVMDALRMAVWRRQPEDGLIFHSDRGSQYCSADFQTMLKIHGMKSSMSRKGDCWDNAVAESFFARLKNDCIPSADFRTRYEARQEIVDYIEMFYNSNRRHSYLGYLTPKEFEEKMALRNVA